MTTLQMIGATLRRKEILSEIVMSILLNCLVKIGKKKTFEGCRLKRNNRNPKLKGTLR